MLRMAGLKPPDFYFARGVLLLNVLFGVTISNNGGTDSVSASGNAARRSTAVASRKSTLLPSSVSQLNIEL